MSMLRRPLTSLELGNDDQKWLEDQLQKKIKAAKKEATKEEKDEPMEVEKKDAVEDRVYKQISSPLLKITGGPALDDLLTYKPPRTLARNLPIASTPQAAPQMDMTTPVNTDAVPPPPPNVRITRAYARQARLASSTVTQPMFQSPEEASSSSGTQNLSSRLQLMPETPEAASSDISPTLRSVEGSPPTDFLANLLGESSTPRDTSNRQ